MRSLPFKTTRPSIDRERISSETNKAKNIALLVTSFKIALDQI